MLFSPYNSLAHQIILMLASQPHTSAEDLRKSAQYRRKKFSTAAIYKSLGQLQEEGVVVKTGQTYSLSLGWIFDVFTFADKVGSAYFSEQYISSLLPERGKRRSWRFSQLIRCNEFWNQLLLAILKASPRGPVYAWAPCPWFVLLQEGRESRLHKALRMTGRTFFTNFGGSTKLLPHIKKIYKNRNQVVSFAVGPFSTLDHTYIDIVGDYVLTITLDPSISGTLQDICRALGTASANQYSNYLHILSQKCSVTVAVEHRPKKASEWRRDFEAFFSA